MNYIRDNVYRILVFLLTLCLLVIVYWYFVLPVIYRAEGRAAMAEAKSVQLAVKVIGYDYYAKDIPFFDQSQKSGFAKGIEDKIRQSAEVTGDIYALQVDETSNTMKQMIYIEGNYIVRLETVDGESVWTIYRNTQQLYYSTQTE